MDTCGRRPSARGDATRRRALAAVTVLLGACDAPPPDELDRSALPDAAYCDPVRTWGEPDRRAEASLLHALEDARAQTSACGALQRTDRLQRIGGRREATECAARRHAQYLVGQETLSHADAEAALVDARVAQAGYEPVIVSELVAAGTVDAARIVDPLWQRSPAHCADLHAPDWQDVGVAALGDPASRWGAVWVVVLGVPQP